MTEPSNKKKASNWYVITGGPSTGKTTVVNLLKERGYRTSIEHARHYIDTKKSMGESTKDIRANEREFQLGVLRMQIQQEQELDPGEIVFLDRAIPDAKAYYRYLQLPFDEELTEAMDKVSYRKIFILDLLPFVKDYARIEDEEAQKVIHDLITEVYTSLPFPVVFVPVLPPEERVDFILENL